MLLTGYPKEMKIIYLDGLSNCKNGAKAYDSRRTLNIQRIGMIVGIMTVKLHMSGIGSLKAKRSIVKSVIERMRNRFNASVSEVDHQDIKNSAVIGIAVVSNQGSFVDRQLDKILDFMRGDGRFYIGQIEREQF